jgi:hypothetical protein
MAGIYLLGPAPGTVVRNNIVHSVQSHGYGGHGIYTDEGSSQVLIEKNVVYDVSGACYNQHYGRENMIRNNVFAFGDEALFHSSFVEEHISFLVERNIFYGTGRHPVLKGKWTKTGYMHRPGRPSQKPVKTDVNRLFDYNLYYNPQQTAADARFGKSSFAQWQKDGQDKHSLYADPKFLDAKGRDFRLAPDSPVLRLGFSPIDLRGVGPREPER